MSLLRRAVWISVGVAAGVGSAPYLTSTSSTTSPTTSTSTPHGCDSGVASFALDGAIDFWLDAAARGAAQVRAALTGNTHHVALAASDNSESSATAASASAVDAAAFRAVPHKLKDRFLHYAQREPETGEFVLTLDGFVRCMLLLPDADGAEEEASQQLGPLSDVHHDVVGGPAAALVTSQRLSSPSSWLQRLSPAVRRRFIHFFNCVDIDGTNSIGYAEFVVLFTFLSTRRQTLERAFHVFDLDDNGRLSEGEFCRLLNTIMVDPAVQVTFSANGREGDGAGSGVRGAGLNAAMTSRAGESRSSERRRQKHRHELSFDLESELLRPLLFGPLPQHVGAPPGSTHYIENAPATALASRDGGGSGGDANVTISSSSSSAGQQRGAWTPSWWSHVNSSVQQLWWQLWSRAASAGTSSSSSVTPLPSRMAELQRMAREDALLETVSYPTFLYRLDYLRWELRAIEFGLCDPTNTGAISVEDCRLLLGRDRRVVAQAKAAAAAATSTSSVSSPQITESATDAKSPTAPPALQLVTWQVYQKLFDVIKESDTILPALQLMLDALPPVPEEVLHGGAIPDAALKPATLAVQEVVRQTVQRYSGGAAETEQQQEGKTSESDGGAASSHLSPTKAAQESFNTERFGLNSDATQPPEETRTQARRVQATLVRPTALTWTQFSQALAAVGTVPLLSAEEEALFRALLDDDASDSLSPTEFAHLCAMKDSFFAAYLPRFDEPKRNAVQQFFFCMQQLE